MCLNLELSLGVWLVGTVGCAYLWRSSFPSAQVVTIALLFALLMQPVEAWLWVSHEEEKGEARAAA